MNFFNNLLTFFAFDAFSSILVFSIFYFSPRARSRVKYALMSYLDIFSTRAEIAEKNLEFITDIEDLKRDLKKEVRNRQILKARVSKRTVTLSPVTRYRQLKGNN